MFLHGKLMFARTRASLIPNARTAQIVAMVLELLPETVRHYAQILPLTHVVTLLRGLWVGDGWIEHFTEVGILAVILVQG